MDPPPGAHLTTQQLIDAMVYKIHTKSHKYNLAQVTRIETRLQTLMALLHGIINTHQPVNRLPPEILADIFKLCQRHYPSFLPRPSPIRRGMTFNAGMEWLQIACVCRHWRGILASYPTLWAEIQHSFQPQMFLRRSRNVPIKFYFGLRPSNHLPAAISQLDVIVPHIHRLKELHLLHGLWGVSENDIFSRLAQGAPQLDSLTINGAFNPGPSHTNRLPELFNGCMSRLRKLTLSWYTKWPDGYFTNLTHLCLFGQDTEWRPSLINFLDFLESSPNLEELALVAAGPTNGHNLDEPPFDRMVNLPYLKELSWGAVEEASCIRCLLEHICLPETTHMYFWGAPTLLPHITETTSNGISSLLPVEQSNLPSISHIREWRFSRSVPRGGSTYIGRNLSPQQVVAFVGSIMFIAGSFSGHQMENMAQTFPMSNLHTFFVEDAAYIPLGRPVGIFDHNQNPVNTIPWKHILSEMKKLRYLALCSTDRRQNVRQFLAELSPAESGEVLCAGLRTITIHDDHELPAFYISSWAEERGKRGAPLTKLEIMSYTILPDTRRMSWTRYSGSPVPPPPPPPIGVFVPPMFALSPQHTATSYDSDSRVQEPSDTLQAEDLAALNKHIKHVDVIKSKRENNAKPVEMLPPDFFTRPVYVWSTSVGRPLS